MSEVSETTPQPAQAPHPAQPQPPHPVNPEQGDRSRQPGPAHEPAPQPPHGDGRPRTAAQPVQGEPVQLTPQAIPGQQYAGAAPAHGEVVPPQHLGTPPGPRHAEPGRSVETTQPLSAEQLAPLQLLRPLQQYPGAPAEAQSAQAPQLAAPPQYPGPSQGQQHPEPSRQQGLSQAPQYPGPSQATHSAPQHSRAPHGPQSFEAAPQPQGQPVPQPQSQPIPQPQSPQPQGRPIPQPQASQAGQLLQYRFDGPDDAPVLVIGPSLGTTWHMWDRQIPELSQHWRIFRYDLPGHGGAPAHPAAAVTDLADRLLATLDSVGVQRFGYAGCSIGGAVGADLALRHPHRVASLVLVAASPRFGTADEFRQRGVIVRSNGLEPIARTAPERWFTPHFAAAQPAIVEWAVQMVRTTDPGCYIASCEALAAFDIRTELSRIGVPTLVLVGAEDEVTGPAEARTLVAGIPDARLALVPGASHLAPVEQPGAVTDLLLMHFSSAWQDTLASIPVPAAPGLAAPFVPVVPVAEIGSGAAPEAATMGRPDRYDSGMKIRREVLGDAHVDAATAASDAFTDDFEELVTRYAWGEIWNREGLDRRARSCVTLTAVVGSGHLETLAQHVRAALRNGLTPVEIKEVLLQTAVYCGIPAAGAAFAIAQSVIQEETTPPA
ncbi:alpha/beta fold hydrolase [Streptomyces sp. NBC_00887]|uniref:bifunctional 3-oxoadipate enol-lactonase/4-carboxymuconolactone decarboxylase PcaDC n=1 Tax=Streptomyces sp. NBC_00887 TaxID=2975859 RepID=UPI00386DC372